MVLQKRLDYGFNGYQVPPTPRATRSARKRNTFKKKFEQNQMCAFDLLAIVAGNLLLEKDSLPRYTNTLGENGHCLIASNSVKKEGQDEENNVEVQAQDQGSLDCCSKEPSYSPNNFNTGIASAVATSEPVDRFDAEKLVNNNKEKGNGASASMEIGQFKLDVETINIVTDDSLKSGKLPNSSVADMSSSEDAVVWDGKPPAHISSNSSTEAPLCGNHKFRSYPPSWDDVNIDSRDDDENCFGCTRLRTTKRFFRPAPRIGDRRIRKILASKYWNIAPRMNAVEWKPHYNKRKTYYNHQRSEKLYPFKKRKHFGFCSITKSERRIRCGFGRNSPQKGSTGDVAGSSSIMNGGNEASSSVADQQNSFQSRDSHVKLRIKSFKVPELFIEVPESATVGILKRTIMDAVTTLLGSGLHVDVLVQGKKLRDDSKTLLQTGISQHNQVEALGFSLEPNSSENHSSLCPADSPFLLSLDAPQALARYPPGQGPIHQTACAASPNAEVANFVKLVESDHDSATDVSIDKSTTDSKALVPLQEMNVEALAVVPPHHKSKGSEIAQRRIRRPFSVAEVEALVQAVEKLGTGRWRDVKLRAFENAKHRTYVDLKDKWKTLVHTARISPQQRRGEPVPQELLDRVLTAHAYWSQQTCLLL